MINVTKVCDRCGNSIDSNDASAKIWNTISLHAVRNVVRILTDIDLCPRCQDIIIDNINEVRESRGLPVFPFKK